MLSTGALTPLLLQPDKVRAPGERTLFAGGGVSFPAHLLVGQPLVGLLGLPEPQAGAVFWKTQAEMTEVIGTGQSSQQAPSNEPHECS